MLLAEIKGKHSSAIETDEDYLTSAVFGHLRFVKHGEFWRKLFGKAIAANGATTNLMEQLAMSGASVEDECDLNVHFWPNTIHGQPDLILDFANGLARSVVVVVEVKLYSEMSSSGSDNQLCKYFELLHDKAELNKLIGRELVDFEIGLVYLTERFAAAEVQESIEKSEWPDAGNRMFPLQWQDMTQVLRELRPRPTSFLGEVFQFLLRRRFDRFQGFQEISDVIRMSSGRFYSADYFGDLPIFLNKLTKQGGGFYGR